MQCVWQESGSLWPRSGLESHENEAFTPLLDLGIGASRQKVELDQQLMHLSTPHIHALKGCKDPKHSLGKSHSPLAIQLRYLGGGNHTQLCLNLHRSPPLRSQPCWEWGHHTSTLCTTATLMDAMCISRIGFNTALFWPPILRKHTLSTILGIETQYF